MPLQWRVPNPQASDIYVVSYPKSGNTWLRYLLSYCIWPHLDEPDLAELGQHLPSAGVERDHHAMLDPLAPCNALPHRLIKEHVAYDRLARRHAKRAIYLVRDGRDAVVSYWHFCNQRDGTRVPLNDFIRMSASSDHSYGPWRRHVMSWMDAPLEAKLVIRYEDLLRDPSGQVAKALEFAEIPVENAVLESAVQRASFPSMQRLEQSKGFNLEQLRTVKFVREGREGGWREVFTEDEIGTFKQFHGQGVPELGYVW